jgi:hypothetical protein
VELNYLEHIPNKDQLLYSYSRKQKKLQTRLFAKSKHFTQLFQYFNKLYKLLQQLNIQNLTKLLPTRKQRGHEINSATATTLGELTFYKFVRLDSA